MTESLFVSSGNYPNTNKLADWLAWLEVLDPSKIELGLDRIRAVYEHLPALSSSTKVVTIAGTNGKGSCMAALQAAALAANKTVVAFSSPHIQRYNERIQVQGEPVEDQALIEAFTQIAEAQNNTSLTYFEYATLAALSIAAEEQPDILILEVGLGGRLDAVNLIDADIVVLTAIGMDHMDWLGNDLESIAYEKCGVIREGKPLILAAPNMPSTVGEQAELRSVELFDWGRDFELLQSPDSSYQLKIAEQEFRIDQLLLHPCSVGGALMAFNLLWPELLPTVIGSVGSAQMVGRYQKLNIGSRQVILDVAHNPMALAYLVGKLRSEGIQKVDLIFAMMSDKDHTAAIEILMPMVKSWKLLQLDYSRAMPAASVAAMLAANGVKDVELINIQATDIQVGQRVKDIFLCKTEQCPLLVTGSFYTVSAILDQPEVKALLTSNKGQFLG